mgnify:CR=1 FL=1|jgi:uncharacterized protein (TIGR02466 family)|tara:strand:+ start:563 stop:1138 length:576 start_codon:yes stop_codon:yes gene_type:complete
MQANIVYPFAEWFLYYENVDVNNERITSYLKNLEYENTSQSNSSKEMYVLSHHNVLKQKFISIIEDGIHQFGYTNKVDIETSWGTLTKTNGYSEFHHHPNYWLSAVYYSSGEGHIEFMRPQIVPYSIKEMQHFTINNTCIQTVKKGDLIVFPSYLRHRIYYYEGKEDRYSIAMNINPIGKIGIKDSEKEKA